MSLFEHLKFDFKRNIWCDNQNFEPLSHENNQYLIQQSQSVFSNYINYTNPLYEEQWFHKIMCDAIDKAVKNTSRDDPVVGLVIEAPPRHGKSEIISRRLPGYYFGHFPDREIIGASYSAELAEDMCMDAQAIMDSELYLDLFPWAYLPDRKKNRQQGQRKRSQTKFQLGNPDHKGRYFSVGAGTGSTGRGAALFIIDDPFKDWEEARSPTIREKRWKWFTTVATTRLAKQAVIIIVCTRWHSDDLVYRAMKYFKIPWTRLTFEGIAGAYFKNGEWHEHGREALEPYDIRQPGEALWDDWFSLKRLKIQRDADPLAFQAMYQQRPPNLGGGLFDNDHWQVWRREPSSLIKVRFWDLGSSSKGDASVGLLMGFTGGKYYILDVERIQAPPPVVIQHMRRIAERDGRIVKQAWEEETGSSGKYASASIKTALAGYPCEAVHVSGSKEVRAEPYALAQQNDLIRIPESAKWLKRFFEEYDNFPGGVTDDIVDAGSGAFYLLSKMTRIDGGMITSTVDLLGGSL